MHVGLRVTISTTPDPAGSHSRIRHRLQLSRDRSNPKLAGISNAGAFPFEIRLARTSYSQLITAKRIIPSSKGTQVDLLPEGVVNDFFDLPDFFRIVVRNLTGKQVLNTEYYFCPVAGKRLAGKAAANSPYPQTCSVNPFALGAVWGIPVGRSERRRRHPGPAFTRDLHGYRQREPDLPAAVRYLRSAGAGEDHHPAGHRPATPVGASCERADRQRANRRGNAANGAAACAS